MILFKKRYREFLLLIISTFIGGYVYYIYVINKITSNKLILKEINDNLYVMGIKDGKEIIILSILIVMTFVLTLIILFLLYKVLFHIVRIYDYGEIGLLVSLNFSIVINYYILFLFGHVVNNNILTIIGTVIEIIGVNVVIKDKNYLKRFIAFIIRFCIGLLLAKVY